mmetsp:Transcript_51917/g.77613  ORF Transcript_51917/g.77613 Transcript_51917/m.77613 type:complete len:224 (+) Transcript_51917:183-854(+)
MVATFSSSMTRAIEGTAKARNVVVFTGAGMSADSGVNPFRGRNGAWNGIFGKLALLWGGTPIGWKWTPSFVWGRFVNDFYGPIAAAKPHPGHTALQELNENSNFDSFAYITMNVDSLHQASGAKNDQVAEVHGSVMKYRCMSCNQKMPNLLNDGLDPKKTASVRVVWRSSTAGCYFVHRSVARGGMGEGREFYRKVGGRRCHDSGRNKFCGVSSSIIARVCQS